MKPIKLLILVLLAFLTLFTSCKEAPVITTGEVIDIESTQVTFTGEVTSDGGAAVTERGFVYSSKNGIPTIGEAATIKVPSDLGSGIGKYTVSMTDLAPAVKIYVRAYAINAVGTSYGAVKDFTTLLPANSYVENGIYLGIGVNIGGLWWAPVNVGAASPTANGGYYQFGRKEKGWTSSWTAAENAWNTGTEAAPIKNTANDPCPDGWRVPTKTEHEALANINEVTITHSSTSWDSGSPGTVRFTCKTTGIYIELPAAGCRYYDPSSRSRNALYYVGIRGYYWSSTTPSDIQAYYSWFHSDGFYRSFSGRRRRAKGFSVRCVKDYEHVGVSVLEGGLDSKPQSEESVSVSVQIGNMIISDRNVGASQDGIAYNYTNDQDHPDHKNSSFKGDYYTWYEALTICPSGWRLPTKEEMGIIIDAMQLSDRKAYLEDGDGNRCYFPWSGLSDVAGNVEDRDSGNYWSSTEGFDYSAWYLSLRTAEDCWGVSQFFMTLGFSVRCVKTAL